MSALLTMLIAVAYAAPARGQETTETDDDVIMVTATRTETLLSDVPDVAHVITTDQIDEVSPLETGRPFEYVPGTSIETGTGSGTPKRSIIGLNGLPANYTLVLVDGVRLLSEHIHTGQNLELIPPQSIERIEIVRGASSAQYGTDAIGGVVNIITRRCGEEPEVSVGVSAGTFDTYQADLGLEQKLGSNVRLTLFANHEQSDGVTIKAPAHRVGNMGYERLTGLARLEVDVSDATQVFGWTHLGSGSMDWQGDVSENWMQTGVVGLTHKFGQAAKLSAQVSHAMWDAERSGERNELAAGELNLHWWASEQHTLACGLDGRDNVFERSAVPDVPGQQTVGGYVQDSWRAGDQLTVLMALRADYVEDIGSMAAPKLSAIYDPESPMRLRCSLARGYHAPTLQELYEEGYGHGGTALRFGNPDLEPEYSTTFTMAYEYVPPGPLDLMLYGHYSDITDMIVPVYEGPWAVDPTKDVWRRTNIASAKVYGAEIAARYRFSERSRIEGGFCYTGNEDEETGRQLPYDPGSALYLKAVGSLSDGPAWKVSCFLGLRCTYGRSAWSWKPEASAPVGDPSGMIIELEDYQNLEAGISAKSESGLSMFLNLDNILCQEIENLDDVFTKIENEVLVRGGVRYVW